MKIVEPHFNRAHAELSIRYIEGRIERINRDVGIMLTIQTALLLIMGLYIENVFAGGTLNLVFVGAMSLLILAIMSYLLRTLKPSTKWYTKSAKKKKETRSSELFLIWPTMSEIPKSDEFQKRYLKGTYVDFAKEIGSTLRQLHVLINRKYDYWNIAVLLCKIQIILIVGYVLYQLISKTALWWF